MYQKMKNQERYQMQFQQPLSHQMASDYKSQNQSRVNANQSLAITFVASRVADQETERLRAAYRRILAMTSHLFE